MKHILEDIIKHWSLIMQQHYTSVYLIIILCIELQGSHCMIIGTWSLDGYKICEYGFTCYYLHRSYIPPNGWDP